MVIHHWVAVVYGEYERPEVFGWAVQNISSLFYVDNGVLASLRPGRMQEYLDVLTGMFERFGLKTNIEKTVGMVCQPFRTAGIHSTEDYIWQMIGGRHVYWGRQKEILRCLDFG